MSAALADAARYALAAVLATYAARGMALAASPRWWHALVAAGLVAAYFFLSCAWATDSGPWRKESVEEWMRRRQREARGKGIAPVTDHNATPAPRSP